MKFNVVYLKAVGWWCPKCKILIEHKKEGKYTVGCNCFLEQNYATPGAQKNWKRVYINEGEN